MNGKKERQLDSKPNKTLFDLALEKEQIDLELEENGGELTEELELLYNTSQIELAKKLDGYGVYLDSLEGEKERLTSIKKLINNKVKDKLNTLETTGQKLKTILNMVGKGESLRGNLYSFHPFVSVTRSVPELETVEDKYKNVTVKLKLLDFKRLIESYASIALEEIPYTILSEKIYLKDLPEEHPSILKTLVPSVRIT